ncbi:MAG: hypothetical protein HOP07_01020 [Bacteriovoracaceae bacterium]|nr:hypothetical protein [Bacteriovoracaceae bacterium]
MPKISPSTLNKLSWVRNDYVIEILLISILIVPFLNLVDIIWMFAPKSYGEWEIIHTPLSIKIIKDILLVTLLITLFFKKKVYSTWSKCSFGVLSSILAFAIGKGLLDKTSYIVLLSGIRWYLPVFLFPLFDEFTASRSTLIKFYERYKLIVLIALPLEILQILFSARWSISEGIAYSRANGFFSQPQPMSLFALFFLMIVFEVIPKEKKTFNYFLSLISIILTKSAAGILGIAYLFFTKATKKYKVIISVVTVIVAVTFPYTSGRLDYWVSPIQRFEVLFDINLNNITFGSYSNTCNTIQTINRVAENCSIPDSLFSSAIGNLGVFLGLSLLGIITYTIYRSKRRYLVPIFILFLISANLTEYFPMNILLPFIIGLKITEENYEQNI